MTTPARPQAIARSGFYALGLWASFWLAVFLVRILSVTHLPGFTLWELVRFQFDYLGPFAVLALRGATGALAVVLLFELGLSRWLVEQSRTALYGCLGWLCSISVFSFFLLFVVPTWLAISLDAILFVLNPISMLFAAWSFALVAAGTGSAKGIGGTLVAGLAGVSGIALLWFMFERSVA